MITGRSRRRLVAIDGLLGWTPRHWARNGGGWVERRLEKVELLRHRSRALPVDDQTT